MNEIHSWYNWTFPINMRLVHIISTHFYEFMPAGCKDMHIFTTPVHVLFMYSCSHHLQTLHSSLHHSVYIITESQEDIVSWFLSNNYETHPIDVAKDGVHDLSSGGSYLEFHFLWLWLMPLHRSTLAYCPGGLLFQSFLKFFSLNYCAQVYAV